MINFASVTGIKIPEGSANALTIGGAEVWSAERWDVDWKYNGSIPPTSDWSYPQGTSLITASPAMSAVAFYAPTDNDVALIKLNKSKHAANNRCVFEVEFNIDTIGYPYGFAIFLLAAPRFGTSADALRCFAKLGESEGVFINVHSASKEIVADEWHVIRMELDRVLGSSRVYIDKELFCEVENNSLEAYGEGDGAAFWTRDARCYVRALRYRVIK